MDFLRAEPLYASKLSMNLSLPGDLDSSALKGRKQLSTGQRPVV